MVQFSVSSGMEGAVEREPFVDGGRVESDRVSLEQLDEVGLGGEGGKPMSAIEERLERGSS